MPSPRIAAATLAWLLASPAAARADSAPATPSPAPGAAVTAPQAASAPAAPAPAAAAPPAAPLPSWFDRIPWLTVLLVVLALAVLALTIWLVVRGRRPRGRPPPAGRAPPRGLVGRWRRQRAAAPSSSEPALDQQLAGVWRPFYRDLPARARHFPTVIVMGDAGSGKSHLIDARVDWRSQANQFFPSAVDSPHLQLYLGSSVVVHELSAPLLRDTRRATRRALARLWRNLGPSATVVVVVDARALATTPPETLRELAELVRGKIGALPARCRAGISVRVCASHMDQIEGYDELVAVIGAQHGPLDARALGDRLTDARAVSAAARAMVAKLDANLTYGLVHRTSDGFARLVGFYAASPVLLTQLAPLLHALTGDDADQPHYPPSELYLTANAPDNHVGDPFTVDRDLVAASIAHQRRFHRRTSLAVAATGVILVGALMWRHDGQVAEAQQAVAGYDVQVSPGRGPGETQARRVANVIARMYAGERLWLGHTFVERKRQIENVFADHLREQYILPKLRVQAINRSTMLYVVALLYASEANGLRALVRDNLALWVSKLDLSLTVVSTYLAVSRDQYETAEDFNPVYTGSDWQSYVFDRVKPLYDQPQRLTQAQLDDLNRDAPQLYDPREYAVRRQIVELLSAQLALATQPSIKKLLDSPLGTSEWVENNTDALRGIGTAVAHNQLAPASPGTLAELGADLARLLAAPATGREVYRVSRVQNGSPETFTFDVAAWNHTLAEASAALTISNVRAQGLAHPERAIGFFPAGDTPGSAGAGGGVQGPTIALPDRYTAAAFARQVAPALDFITTRAGGLGLSSNELAQLAELYRAQIDDYAARYAGALRAYYDSFRFDPGSEEALPFALAAMVQPSSWFLQFMTTVSTNASPALSGGPYYQIMADSLADFRPLAELLASAKGAIPGLLPYQKIVADLATALDPAGAGGASSAGGAGGASAAAPGDDTSSAGAPTTTLAGSLSHAGSLTLDKLTGADKDRAAQVSGWLNGANVERSLHAPFLAPVEAAYSFGLSDINRAVRRAWNSELSPLINPILARFPFRPGAATDVAVADLEAVLRAQGKQPGSFWAGFARWLGPVTVQRSGRYQWLGDVSGPTGALATINDLARLSRALWDADGNPTALPIDITPQPLDATPAGGRVTTLASLRTGSAAVYAFNQRPGPSTLALPWWDQGASSIFLRLSKPGTSSKSGTSDTVTYSVDAPESPFSFFRLLCRSRRPNRALPPDGACDTGRGPRVWDVPLGASSARSVTFTLDTDPWALFHIGR